MDKNFLGSGWAFSPVFEKTAKNAVMVTAEEDIRESLRILLGTAPGERVMHPSYGCGLNRMVFENINESTITEIKDIIQKAILHFEARITLEDVYVDSTNAHDGVLKIGLDYTIRTTNTRRNVVFPFYLHEGSNLGLEQPVSAGYANATAKS
jgi:phage baseplate assembly protein W